MNTELVGEDDKTVRKCQWLSRLDMVCSRAFQLIFFNFKLIFTVETDVKYF